MRPDVVFPSRIACTRPCLWLLGVVLLLLPTPAFPADLAIQRLSLHQYDDGPLVSTSYEYLPGEIAWFTGRVTGYQREKAARADGKGDDERVRLTWTVRVLDPEGLLIDLPQSGNIVTNLLTEDKDWVAKFGLTFTIPQYAARGVYHVPVTVKDEVNGREVSAEITFRVRGEEISAGQKLGVMNFRFLAHEDDKAALQPARYKPGDDVWIRFDVVGYKLAANNRFLVEYGIEILGPEPDPFDAVAVPQPTRRPLFSQPVAATESGESYYPQRRVPGGYRVTLDEKVPLGAHTLVLTLRDKIGDTTQELRLPFEVR